jgi:biotin carboxyl carrier protein
MALLPGAAEPVPIEIKPGKDTEVLASIDGREISLDARRVATGTYSIADGTRMREVSVVRREQGSLASTGDHEVSVQLIDRRRYRAGGGGAGATGARQIKAVMPGKVVTLLVAVGDHVEVDQPVLVLEAMKMENDVRSPGAGTVKEILVVAGQAVETGELMVELE